MNAIMEKPAEAEALRAEYLDLLKIMWVTCLKGIRRAKAHMVGTFLGMLVTQSAFLGALYFLEDTAVIAILVIVSLLTLEARQNNLVNLAITAIMASW